MLVKIVSSKRKKKRREHKSGLSLSPSLRDKMCGSLNGVLCALHLMSSLFFFLLFLLFMSVLNLRFCYHSHRSCQGFMHMKFTQCKDGKYVLGQNSPPFDTIPELIHFYTTHKLPIRGAEHLSLLFPVLVQTLWPPWSALSVIRHFKHECLTGSTQWSESVLLYFDWKTFDDSTHEELILPTTAVYPCQAETSWGLIHVKCSTWTWGTFSLSSKRGWLKDKKNVHFIAFLSSGCLQSSEEEKVCILNVPKTSRRLRLNYCCSTLTPHRHW